MLELMQKCIEDFYEQANKYYDDFEKGKKQLHEQLSKGNITGKYYDEKLVELTRGFNNLLNSAIRSNERGINNDYDSSMEKLNKIISQPPTVNFTQTIEALKVSAKYSSDYELRTYLDTHKDNYLATSTLLNIFHEVGKNDGVSILSAEYVRQQLENAKDMAIEYLHNFIRGGISMALYAEKKTSPIVAIGEKIQPFFNKQFLREKGDK